LVACKSSISAFAAAKFPRTVTVVGVPKTGKLGSIAETLRGELCSMGVGGLRGAGAGTLRGT
jgi:hypothetical protein